MKPVTRNNLMSRSSSVLMSAWLSSAAVFEVGVVIHGGWRAPFSAIAYFCGAYLASMLATNIPVVIDQFHQVMAAIDAIEDNPQMRVQEVPVQAYFAAPAQPELKGFQPTSVISRMKFSQLRCFVLKKREPHSGLLAMPFTFNGLIGSFIFLGDTPQDIATRPAARPMALFTLLHEIGHTSSSARTEMNLPLVRSIPLLVASLGALSALPLNRVTLICFLLIASTFIASRLGTWDKYSVGSLRNAEIAADLFALKNLEPSDLVQVARTVEHIAFKDPTLTAEENLERHVFLRKNASHIADGGNTFFARWNPPPMFILPTMIAIFALGFQSQTRTIGSIIWEIALLFLIGAVFYRCHALLFQARGRLDHVVAANA